MKIKFSPSKAAMLDHLGGKLKECQADIDEAQKALAELGEEDPNGFYNPHKAQERLGWKARIGTYEKTESHLQTVIGLLESSETEYITAEEEI